MSCGCNHSSDVENIFLPMEVEVLSATQMTATETHFRLRCKDGAAFDFEPGQIVEAGVFGYGEIPLGLASSPTQTDSFDLVIRKVGKVSSALTALKAGDTMTIRGPLGTGFPVDELKGRDVLVVAGGIGLCPTRSIINYILDKRDDFGAFTLFFGTRSPSELLFQEDLATWRASDKVAYHETVDTPDDTWTGKTGVITTLFEDATGIDENTKVIICGPPIMYKFVVRQLDDIGVLRSNIYVDLERRMKCGVGKCGHCQINDKYVCVDGPVFRFSDIEDLEEAI